MAQYGSFTIAQEPAMIPITRLNHAVLYVRDLDASVDFYRRAFGFEEIAREGEQNCPVSRALRNNVEIRLKAFLET